MSSKFGVATKINGGELGTLVRYHYVHISSVAANHKVSCKPEESNGITAFSQEVYVLLNGGARYQEAGWYNYGYYIVNPKDSTKYLPAQKPNSTRGSVLPIATHVRFMGGNLYFIPYIAGTAGELDFTNKVEMQNMDELAVIAKARSFPRQHVQSGNGVTRSVSSNKTSTPKVKVSREEVLKLESRLETLTSLAISGLVNVSVEKQIDDTINELRKLGDGKFVDELFIRVNSSIIDDSEVVVENTSSEVKEVNLDKALKESEKRISDTFEAEMEEAMREDEMAKIREAIASQTSEAPKKKSKKAAKVAVVA